MLFYYKAPAAQRIEISFADRWFLILYSGRFFAVLNNTCKSAGTLVLLLQNCKETARLMFCRICNPTAKNIRICDPKNTPINQKIGSKRIENPYTQFRQIANQPVHQSCWYISVGTGDYKSAGTLVLLLHIRRTSYNVNPQIIIGLRRTSFLHSQFSILNYSSYFCRYNNFAINRYAE